MAVVRDERGRFVKGQPPHNVKPKLRKVCAACGKVFYVRPSWDRVQTCSRSCARKGKPSPWKGRSPSAETREKQRLAKLGIRGEDHWNWRGGAGTERHQLMQQDEYKQWRRGVFERDDYTCHECGVRGGYLEAHHIQSWAEYPELRYELTNGLTLCRRCHRKGGGYHG